MPDIELPSDILSFVALGDSFTEGMDDLYADSEQTPNGRYRGWADRVAEHLTGHVAEVRYANLAVRGKLIRQIIDDQLGRAVELRPDLVTFCAGGNDLIRPGGDPDELAEIFRTAVTELRGTGATVVVFTGWDPGFQPIMRHLRGKIAIYDMNLRAIADEFDCPVVDLWGMKPLRDHRAWSWDRLHLSSEGHRRLALRVCEVLDVPVQADWRAPWPPEEPMPWQAARQQDLHWAKEFLLPWIQRRFTGRSSGDGLDPKRPDLEPVPTTR